MIKQKTVVIGAGVTGLAAADALKSAGQEVVVLEATQRAGGRLVRIEHNGDSAEAGGQGIHTNYDEMRRLLGKYGMSKDLLPQSHHTAGYLDRQGQVQFPDGHAGLMKLMNTRGKLDTMWFGLRYLTLGKKYPYFENNFELPQYDNISSADAFSWAGEDFHDFILRPAAHAMCNTTPEHTNLYHMLGMMRLVSTTTVSTLRHGNASLAEKMAPALGVQFETPVQKVLLKNNRVEGVLLENGQTIKADNVIVTCPGKDAERITPDELTFAKDFLGNLPNAPFSLVYFFLDRAVDTKAYAFTGFAHRKTVFNMALNHTLKTPHLVPSGKTIISAWPSFPDATKLAGMTDDAVIAQALSDMEAFVPGIGGMIEAVKIQKHPWGITRMEPGSVSRSLRFRNTLQSYPGLYYASNEYDGVHMESGIHSGLRSANAIIENAR